jgi:16S rRNA (cytosine967-C5)-methyltransferase
MAAKILVEVIREGQSLSTVLPPALETLTKPSDRSLLQEYCYGVLRWYFRLEAISGLLLRKSFKSRDADIHYLLLLGLYQIIYMRVPDHAAVNETVAAVRSLKKNWASGLVNAVLRSFQRDAETLEAKVDQEDTATFSHPEWFVSSLKQDWPQQWREILLANNSRAPMSLRVNERIQDRQAYGERLQQNGITFHIASDARSGLILDKPVDVTELPGFAEGHVSVQDCAAQMAAGLLDTGPGMRVLDACAAPGGKTAHILERQADLEELVALDIDQDRLNRVEENLARLGLQARLLCGDAGQQDWWDGIQFNRILLDVPCSATGVIRRHPDIKVLRRAKDIDKLVQRQKQILETTWNMLAQGSKLVYATCSVLARENTEQLQTFLESHNDARELPIEAGWGQACSVGRQILPGEDEMDGFYYAVLQKT